MEVEIAIIIFLTEEETVEVGEEREEEEGGSIGMKKHHHQEEEDGEEGEEEIEEEEEGIEEEAGEAEVIEVAMVGEEEPIIKLLAHLHSKKNWPTNSSQPKSNKQLTSPCGDTLTQRIKCKVLSLLLI